MPSGSTTWPSGYTTWSCPLHGHALYMVMPSTWSCPLHGHALYMVMPSGSTTWPSGSTTWSCPQAPPHGTAPPQEMGAFANLAIFPQYQPWSSRASDSGGGGRGTGLFEPVSASSMMGGGWGVVGVEGMPGVGGVGVDKGRIRAGKGKNISCTLTVYPCTQQQALKSFILYHASSSIYLTCGRTRRWQKAY